MPKTAMLTARVDPGLKSDAEGILGQLGIPAGSAITMFYRQIVIHKGLPFPVTLEPQPVPSLGRMTREDFDREMEIGATAIREGRYRPAEDVFGELRRRVAE